jgi:hypothetical protein
MGPGPRAQSEGISHSLAISFNPEPTATEGRHPLEMHGLGDRGINDMTRGDKSAVAVGSGLNEISVPEFAVQIHRCARVSRYSGILVPGRKLTLSKCRLWSPDHLHGGHDAHCILGPGTNRVIACEGGRRPQTGHLVVVFVYRKCGSSGARSGDRAQQEPDPQTKDVSKSA